MKKLIFNEVTIEIEAPIRTQFTSDFDESIYTLIYDEIICGNSYEPVIDVDDIYNKHHQLDLKSLSHSSGLNIKPPNPSAPNFARSFTQEFIRDFMLRYPIFLGLVCNCVVWSDAAIENAELLKKEKVTVANFIDIKRIIDEVNRTAWTRDRDVTESQSGVSNLGQISEKLLHKAFGSLVDNKNFFPVGKSHLKAFGDFVLMCLPNNLWLSVKSNFGRERLLASGFSNDILGVGFFQDAGEFQSQSRIRNFQKAGFLAMYLPDVSVSEEQVLNESNTYQEVMDSYNDKKVPMPTNINGKPFIRKLSDLSGDLKELLEEEDIRKRYTLEF